MQINRCNKLFKEETSADDIRIRVEREGTKDVREAVKPHLFPKAALSSSQGLH